MNPFLPRWSDILKPVIGMLHLHALPGAPLATRSVPQILDHILRDAETLSTNGVDGLMMENFGDVPFYPTRVPAYVVAYMTAIACEVRKRFDLPLGINVLRNDGLSALAVAQASGAAFIRVNVLCGARVTDQGVIQGIAHDLLRERAMLNATGTRIMADVDVKHSAALAPRPIEDEVDDMLERGLADALIVSGAGTGKATDPAKAKQVKARAGDRAPIFIGSGASTATIDALLPHVDGFIIGTAFKRDGNPNNPVEASRVRELMQKVKGR
jgi:membrane complex biogenesis BtpA family protein